MNCQRLTVKFFIQDPVAVDLEDFVPIFHRWIQNQSLEGLLIDVADYKHIHNGPGIVLIGDRADYAIDMGEGRPGLLLRRKRQAKAEQPLTTKLGESIHLALRAVHALENDSTLRGRIAFRTDEIVFGFPDRLNLPNNSRALSLINAQILTVLKSFYPGVDLKIEPASSDPRRVFALNVRAPAPPEVSALIKNFETALITT